MKARLKGLPLLARELTEASVKRSTYIYRVILAVTLSFAGLYVLSDAVIYSNPYQVLGRGRDLLEAIVYVEFLYIYTLLPVLAAGAFTEEKERDTLSLLLITRLGPWTIIFEKILGRLVPMLAMIMLTLPLLMVAYSLGGVSLSAVVGAAFLLIVGSLQVISIAVMTSAICGKTVVAYLVAWIVGVTTASIPTVLDEMGVISIRLEEMTVPPALFDSMLYRPVALHWVMIVSIPTLLICAASACVGRYYLTRCETKARKLPIAQLLGWLDDTLRSRLRFVFAKGVSVDVDRPLPEARPIYWKETHGAIITRPRYQKIVSGLCTIVAGIAMVIGAETEADDGLTTVYFVFLAIVALAAVAKSATLISGERSRQTLDILLSTPLTSREIIRQKMAGIHSLMLTFALPFLLILLIDAIYRQFFLDQWARRSVPPDDIGFEVGLYLAGSIVTVMIYLPMLSWLAALIGFRVRKQMTALFLSLATIIAWGLVPMFITIGIFEATGVRPGDPEAIWLVTSPLPFLVLQEVVEINRLFPSHIPIYAILLLNTAIYGTVLMGLRWLCLSRADSLLRRTDTRAASQSK